MTTPFLRRSVCAALALAVALPWAPPVQATRIKDVAQVQGARGNQLVGYGLVVGLDGTGDTQRTTFTIQSLIAMLSRMGVRVEPNLLFLRNVAAVTVTATLPPFAEPGTTLDVVVSSIGDARSLLGGTLLLTPMQGVDGRTYAMAQGPLQVGGFRAQGNTGSMVQKNQLNVGRIASGGIIERGVETSLISASGSMRLQVRKPDLTTAQRIAEAVNNASPMLGGGPDMARADGGGGVVIQVPEAGRANLGVFLAQIEALAVAPDAIAKVIINSRTGTVVMGDNVRISTVAVAHGGLTLEVAERFDVVQPGAFAGGDTAFQPGTDVRAEERGGALELVPAGTTLADVIAGLNALGATPRDLIDILQAISAAGALHGELEVL